MSKSNIILYIWIIINNYFQFDVENLLSFYKAEIKEIKIFYIFDIHYLLPLMT